ncbi:MAG: bifunctional hydroxymethylpyrimidine kinase/phosphomethylpyrimidine kinase, partial [Firmicutes bacterium]|nr:bifunctional hydroxymethylpyrimidine kinase/phosphomethylpyrimidine kinase [Bacillota bacterium]
MMNRQKHIAAIHDLSGAGRCSLTVALPVISAAGVTCSCIPTALLSTHTGEFADYVVRDLSEFMLPIARHWRASGLVFDGIYSGYLASPGQAMLLAEVIGALADKNTLILVDPVMADNGRYYANLDARMCAAFRALTAYADLITPNVTEAALLTGLPYQCAPQGEAYIRALFDGLFALGAKTVALTGVSLEAGMLGNAIARKGEAPIFALREARDGVFYGTGGLFASA